VQKTVRQRLHKLHHKMTNLAQDRHKLESYLPYQCYGTLLVTQRVPRGATSATVANYYSPEQTLVTIPLDPRLSLHDNAQVYFKKSRKAQHGLVKVQELLTQLLRRTVPGRGSAAGRAGRGLGDPGGCCRTRCLALPAWNATSCDGPDTSSVAIPDIRVA
jgi:hypothetical protein